jgi:hypothetical protein
MVQRPAAEQNVKGAPPQWAGYGGVRDAAPEPLQCDARALRAAMGEAVGQHGGIHRAGRGAGDRLDLEPWFLQQAIECTPGERAMRTAALQREVDKNRRAARCSGVHRCLRHRRSCAKEL